MSAGMLVRLRLVTLLVVLAVFALPGTVLAHNVTFQANLKVLADGRAVEVHIADVIRNPVADATVSLRAASGGAVLTESEPGLYYGVLPGPVQPGERVRLEVQVGQSRNDIWSGGIKATTGGEANGLLTHQHGIDGRTFSITMTSVFGGLLVIIAIYEVFRLRRRRQVQAGT